MSFKNILIEITETILVSLIIITIIYASIASIEVVSGASMAPTFHTDERILVEKITKYFKPFNRGEVVVVLPPTDSRHYIKRIIGLPGDIFKIFDCKIYISKDGAKFQLTEDYLNEDTCTSGGVSFSEGRSIKLGDDEYVILGDNRGNSIDSRAFGVISKKEIIGRVIYRFWPLSKAGFIK